MKAKEIIANGIIKENPVLVLVLGTCPTLAITTMAVNGLGMGVAATLVLICSNAGIALLKDIIPDQVRIPCYIVFIAAFVGIVSQLVEAFTPGLYDALGIFLPLIVVNCIILGRAEMFASKNSVKDSILDGLGMGLGFTLALVLMSSIREILGTGTWFGMQVLPAAMQPISIMILPPGGFFVYGILIALINIVIRKRGGTPVDKSKGCSGCAMFDACQSGVSACALSTAGQIENAKEGGQ
jgi:electron transport complex protein RnfE